MKELLPKLIKIVPHILAVGVGVMLFLNYNHRAKKSIAKTKIDFPLLRREESLNEKVKETYCPPEIRCSTPPIFVIFANGVKRSINAKEMNEGTVDFIEAISAGDSLVKRLNDDTLFLYHDGAVDSYLLH